MAIRIMPIFPTVLNSINSTLTSIYATLVSYLSGILSVMGNFTFDGARRYSLIQLEQNHSFIHSDSDRGYFEYSTEPVMIAGSTETEIIWMRTTEHEELDVHMAAFPKIGRCANGVIMKIYERPEPGELRPVSGFDRNRSRDLTHTLQLKTGLARDFGTLIYQELIVNGGQNQHEHDKMEFILKQETYYLITLTNLPYIGVPPPIETPLVQVILNWYEPRS